MNEHDLEPLEPSLARLLAAERERPGPDADMRAALWESIASGLGSGPGGGAASPPASPGSARPEGAPKAPAPKINTNPPGAAFTMAGGRAIGALIATFIAGGVIGGAIVAALHSSEPAPAAVLVPIPVLVAAPSAADSAAPSASAPVASVPVVPAPMDSAPPSAVESASARPRTDTPAPATAATAALSASAAHRDVDLAAERSLLDEARAALARGQGQQCLATLGRHQAEFPAGRLSSEREVLWIQALVVSGRRDEAVRRAQAFRAAHPKSLLWPAVESAVGTVP